MFKRLAHVCISATDLAATERFYVDLLGLEKAFDFRRGGEKVGFYLKAGESTFIEVFAQADEPAAARPLIRHFCLEVEDLHAAAAALKSKGVDVCGGKLGGDGAWQAWITDPGGIRIELMQYGENSSRFSGGTVDLN